MYSQEPFVSAANTAILHDAFDRLVGAGRWHLVAASSRSESPSSPAGARTRAMSKCEPVRMRVGASSIPARSIYAIRSSPMRPNFTAGRSHASWRSRRSCLPLLFGSIASTTHRQWRSQFNVLSRVSRSGAHGSAHGSAR
jgi:hypothetical protein